MKTFICTLLSFCVLAMNACRAGDPQVAAKDEVDIEPISLEDTIDVVKSVKDPKSGWFGPKLRHVYRHREDNPTVFCDSGPSIPTGEEVTIFYRMQHSTPESSECYATVAVVKGLDGHWLYGKAMTKVEYAEALGREKRIHTEALFGNESLPGQWRLMKPIGDPCPKDQLNAQNIGSAKIGDIPALRNCSSVITTRTNHTIFFRWWMPNINEGDISAADYNKFTSVPEVIENTRQQYGDRYFVDWRN